MNAPPNPIPSSESLDAPHSERWALRVGLLIGATLIMIILAATTPTLAKGVTALWCIAITPSVLISLFVWAVQLKKH